jgi:gustatory receptor
MEVEAIFEPLWTISKILGMTPFHIDSRRLVYTKIKILYSVTILTLCTTSLIVFFNQMPSTLHSDIVKLKTIRLLVILHSLGIFILMGFIIIFVVIKWGKVHTEIRTISLIDLELQKLGRDEYILKSNRQVLRTTTVLLVLVQLVFNTLGGIYTAQTKRDNRVLYFIVMTCPRLVVSNMNIIFYVIMTVLRERFKVLNKILTMRLVSEVDFCHDLHSLVHLHKALTRISQTVNSIFSIQLLVWISADFVLIVGDLYTIMYILLAGLYRKYYSVFYGLLKNCVMYSFDLYYLARTCRSVCIEVSQSKCVSLFDW